MLRAERQSTRMSKITNNGLTRYGTGCFIVVAIWQQWAGVKPLIKPNKTGYWQLVAGTILKLASLTQRPADSVRSDAADSRSDSFAKIICCGFWDSAAAAYSRGPRRQIFHNSYTTARHIVRYLPGCHFSIKLHASY